MINANLLSLSIITSFSTGTCILELTNNPIGAMAGTAAAASALACFYEMGKIMVRQHGDPNGPSVPLETGPESNLAAPNNV
jgi:hypothetical protein